jgi:hypothetical protein
MNYQTDAECWRIVEIKNGHYHTLFHGLPSEDGRRSRRLPKHTWLEAEEKMVSYGRGSPQMLSGFNVILSKPECEAYLGRFKDHRELKVVRCLAQELRPKPRANSDVWLARRLMIVE